MDHQLPPWRRVLAVVAHPDDESFALGAVLDAFVCAGARAHVLCLTHGEASTLGAEVDDLGAVRADELEAAAEALGVSRTTLCAHPDGALAGVDPGRLRSDVANVLASWAPDGVLVFDPAAGVTGHADHAAASLAALDAARESGVPVLGWALPEAVAATLDEEFGASFVGYPEGELDLRVAVDRSRQRLAVQAHTTQAVPGSVLWRRLELLEDGEFLRRLA